MDYLAGFLSYFTTSPHPAENPPITMPGTYPNEQRLLAMAECAACMEECEQTVSVGEDHLCEECFEAGYVTQFQDALKDESKFPVKYGPTVLEPTSYAKFFTKEFFAAWKEKEREYKTPVQSRLYCKHDVYEHNGEHSNDGAPIVGEKRCGEFLGGKPPDTTGKNKTVLCVSCNGQTCTDCSGPMFAGQNHHCQEEADAFGGLERGVDYQMCPGENCKVKATLRDGCNEVRCAYCDVYYCYICGSKSSPGHWNARSSCPRFGKKGSERAIYDHMILQPFVGPQNDPWARFIGGEGEAENPNRSAGWRERRLMEHDARELAAAHTRILQVEDPDDSMVSLHLLIHELETGIQAYVAHLNPTSPRIQDVPEWQQRHQWILDLARLSVPVCLDYMEVLRIFNSFNAAWEGRLEELVRIMWGARDDE